MGIFPFILLNARRYFTKCKTSRFVKMELNVNKIENKQFARHLSIPNLIDFGQSMPGGFFVYKAYGKEELLYANEIVLDIFGCKNIDEFKNLTGFTFKGMVYENDFERIENSIVDQVKSNTKKLDYVEYRIRRKDGQIRWVDDYGRLVNTIEYGEVYFVLIRDITEQHNTLENLVEMDHLTNVYNRRHFDREILIKTTNLIHFGGSLCMIMIDIDKFKDYNDHYGHPLGDKCLTKVAEIMRKTLRRKSDLLFRYGGEEFAVLISDISLENACIVAEKIRCAVHDLNILHAYSPCGAVSISAGVAVLEDEEARCLTNPSAELVKLADAALYEAKNNGRNCVRFKKAKCSVLSYRDERKTSYHRELTSA